jgi:hypothetical protein
MGHYSEDDLILYYYGEGRRREEIERHLDACETCAAQYRSIADSLALMSAVDVPARADAYSLEVWQRIRSRLPEQDPPWWTMWFTWKPLSMAAAAAVLIAAAFVAGRMWPAATPAPTPIVAERAVATTSESGDRIRLAAIGDHLEQSKRVLLDLVNAQGERVNLSDQQTWAADLIDSNRLYRDAANLAGDVLVATVLDDLERSLLDVVHAPSTVTPAQLDDVRTRMDAAALLFKVRILADELHEREVAPAPIRKRT